jgi:glycosyltransferase involved in cell wall biosynthesis
MSAVAGLKVLLVTPLDFAARPNNSEHNRAREYSRAGCEVTVLYKIGNGSPRLRDMIRDTCTFRVVRSTRGPLRLVGVDPLFNYFGGYRRNAEARSAAAREKRPGPRLALIRLLSPLAVLRDVFFLPGALYAAYRHLERRYDVCLGVGPWGGLAGWILRAVGRVSMLVYIDRDYEAGLVPDRLRRSYTERVERFGIRRADIVVCVGRLLAERRQGYANREMHVLPNGVDWDNFAPSRKRERTGRTLIYVGNVIGWAGVEHAIRAMPSIRDRVPDAKLRIVGGGLPDYMRFLRTVVDELRVQDCVELLGERPRAELAALLADADIGLANSEPVPFRIYACPIKVLEYMAAGVPVIATADTEAGNFVGDLGCGLAVPYATDALADAAVSLLGDTERHRTHSANGIEQSQRLTWEHLVGREIDLIAARRAS